MKATPRVLFSGPLTIGGWVVAAYVLDDGRRVLSFADTLRIFRGRSRSSAQALIGEIASHPSLRATNVAQDSSGCLTPVEFIPLSGSLSSGIDANNVITICHLLMLGRENGLLTVEQGRAARIAERIVLAVARVGLTALIDEATGFQGSRERDALQKLLDQYLRKDLAAWSKRFPDEFYKQIFRLRKWQWKGMKENRPGVVGSYTKDIVYSRLAPGILEELEQRNPSDGHGTRHAKHHQWLTEEIGHPALAKHIYEVLGVMRASSGWEQFKTLLKRSHPRIGDQMSLELADFDLD